MSNQIYLDQSKNFLKRLEPLCSELNARINIAGVVNLQINSEKSKSNEINRENIEKIESFDDFLIKTVYGKNMLKVNLLSFNSKDSFVQSYSVDTIFWIGVILEE